MQRAIFDALIASGTLFVESKPFRTLLDKQALLYAAYFVARKLPALTIYTVKKRVSKLVSEAGARVLFNISDLFDVCASIGGTKPSVHRLLPLDHNASEVLSGQQPKSSSLALKRLRLMLLMSPLFA